jgi:hypothetical protein
MHYQQGAIFILKNEKICPYDSLIDSLMRLLCWASLITTCRISAAATNSRYDRESPCLTPLFRKQYLFLVFH